MPYVPLSFFLSFFFFLAQHVERMSVEGAARSVVADPSGCSIRGWQTPRRNSTGASVNASGSSC